MPCWQSTAPAGEAPQAREGADEMPERMAAVVNHGPEHDRLEEVARPHAGPGEVVIQVEAAAGGER